MNGTIFQEKEEREKKEGMTYTGPLDSRTTVQCCNRQAEAPLKKSAEHSIASTISCFYFSSFQSELHCSFGNTLYFVNLLQIQIMCG